MEPICKALNCQAEGGCPIQTGPRGVRISSKCIGSEGEVQSPAPSKKAGSELGALAVSKLEAQRGTPRGNCHHPDVSCRSQRLKDSFFFCYRPPPEQLPGGRRGLRGRLKFPFTLFLMSILQSQFYLPLVYKAATASARAELWIQQSHYMVYCVQPSVLKGCMAMPRAGSRQLYAKKSLGSALN